MSKVTRSKLKFLIYILLQETNKINRKFFQILNDFFRTHSSASRAFVTRKRFSACWGNSPIPIERCLRHRAAASPFHSGPRKADVHRTSCARSGCFNGSSCQRKKARCSMSITPTLHRTFHHRLLCLFSSSCRTSCSCSCSFFCSSSFRISCTIFCATSQSCISDLVLRYSA